MATDTDGKLLDKNGLLYTWQKIKVLLGDYVLKENGKSLISDSEILRLANVTNYDDTNVQSAISVLQQKVSELENGTYDDTQLREDIANTYATLSALSNHMSDTNIHITTDDVSNMINNAIGGVIKFDVKKLSSEEYDSSTLVPSITGEKGIIYLVPKGDETNNVYIEFIWDGTSFEKLGDTEVNLTNYVTKDDVITNAEIDEIFAS